MTESIQPPQEPPVSEFVRSFDLVESVAGEPGKYFMAYEAKNRTDRSQVPPNYVIIEVDGKPANPYTPPYGKNLTFRRWETNDPTVTQDFAAFGDLSLTDRTEGRRQGLLEGDSLHARHWLPGEWVRYERSEDDVAHLLKYVFDQNVRGGFSIGGGLGFAHLTQGLIVRSLQYADRPNASVMTDAIHESIAVASPQKRGELIAKIYPSLGKSLLRASFQSYAARTVAEALPAENIVRGIELYDRAGLVSDKFWISFGIDATATVVTPEFAPLLASKLAGPDGERLIREYVAYPRRAAQAYATNVLEAYSKDP